MLLPQNKIKYKRGFKKWTDEKAIEVRKELGLYASSPLCAFKLCQHLNIPVLVPSDVQGLTQKHLDILLNSGVSDWSAATIPLPNEKFLIIHNPHHSEGRQQSNLMHELAHIICGHKVSESKMKTGLTGFLRNFDEQQENEAEWFGSCLQLPRPALLYSLKRNMTIDNIASHYNCSTEMVQYRINITGVKRQLAYTR